MEKFGWDILQFERNLEERPRVMIRLFWYILGVEEFKQHKMDMVSGKKKMAPTEWKDKSPVAKAQWRDAAMSRSRANEAGAEAALVQKFGSEAVYGGGF